MASSAGSPATENWEQSIFDLGTVQYGVCLILHVGTREHYQHLLSHGQ
jgi:hypothetical protein